MPWSIIHHGGADGVTGSCHRLQVGPGQAVLIDCGLFQGADHGPAGTLERHRVRFPVDDVRALIVTHVHIDHVGRIPYLLAAGYQGPILCSPPSARLLPLVLEDALRVGFTRDDGLIERSLAEIRRRVHPLPYGRWHGLLDGAGHEVRVRLQRAGHILGSAYAELDVRRKGNGHRDRIVFSGDLGAPHAPLLTAPAPPRTADVLVLESTYGDRRHSDREHRRDRLRAAIDHALENAGTVVVPAFSIGRTQELLYELEELIHEASATAPDEGPPDARTRPGRRGRTDWSGLEIIVDSPLAAEFTAVYRDLKGYWDAEAMQLVRAGRHPLSFENLYTVGSHEEHLRTVDYLDRTGRPAVVIAASGMCAGGRVVNYLARMLDDPRHAVLFVGYQAAGTPGRAIQRAAPGERVRIDGQSVAVHARVETIGGYSAHADQADLLAFVRGMRAKPREIRLTHGEREAKMALARALERLAAREGFELSVVLPSDEA